MDVLNLSLGGLHPNSSGRDVLSIGLDNAVDAGLVVAVAAGNSGPGAGTLESPGRAPKVITVGASTNQHFVGQPFTYPAITGTTIGAAVGEFPALPTASYDLFDTHSTACTSVDPGASGKLAIVDRGSCTFSTKVRNAIAAVAVGVKPDLTSVGVNVLSSITCVGKPETCPGDGTGWAFFSGTSMSTPHIAGSAAVLLQLHNDWSPAEVKSALVNRADLVVKDAVTGTHDVGPTAQGTGRENLSVAADATTWMDPVSASFGKVTVGHPTSVTITLHNPTGTPQTFAVSKLKFTPSTFGNTVPLAYNAGDITMGDDRISVPASVTVPAEGSTTLRVTVNAGMG